jgi:hypothetical protein
MSREPHFGAVILLLQLAVFAMVLAMVVLLVRRCATDLSEVDFVVEDYFVEEAERWGDDQATGSRPAVVGAGSYLVP